MSGEINLKIKFNGLNIKNIPKFSINGMYFCKVLKVFDGDTITLGFFLNDHDPLPYRINCRMYGYDTPETTRAKTPEEKLEGKRCSQVLKALLPVESFVIAEFMPENDKYGRALVKIFKKKTAKLTHTSVAKYKIPSTLDCEPFEKNDIGNKKNIICINNWMCENVVCFQNYYGGTKKDFQDLMKDWHTHCSLKNIQCYCHQCEIKGHV